MSLAARTTGAKCSRTIVKALTQGKYPSCAIASVPPRLRRQKARSQHTPHAKKVAMCGVTPGPIDGRSSGTVKPAAAAQALDSSPASRSALSDQRPRSPLRVRPVIGHIHQPLLEFRSPFRLSETFAVSVLLSRGYPGCLAGNHCRQQEAHAEDVAQFTGISLGDVIYACHRTAP